jgi:hypothetical protein
MRQYSQDAYYRNLLTVYQTATQRSRNSAAVTPLGNINNAILPAGETDGR